MNLQSLRQALAPLTKFGSDESEFDVEGTSVALRPLLPREEISCQQYAAAVLATTQDEEGLEDEDPLTRTAALRYFDQFRIEVISYALVQVDDTDLRETSFIETGETLENGTAVKVAKNVALRDIITESWSRGMITIAFSKYGDLITVIAEKADKVAKASVADLDAEIERVEGRLTSLREEREKRAKGDPSVTYDQIRSLVSAGEALEREVDQTIDTVRADRESAASIRKDIQDRAEARLAEEEAAAAAAAEQPAPPAPAPPPAPVARQPVSPKTAPPPSAKVKPPEFVSSFADPDEDPHALDMEEARIQAARVQAASDSKQDLVDPLSRAEQVGSVTGPDGEAIPAYRLPSETISSRGREPEGPRGKKKVPVDPDPQAGSINPNFKPSGRG